jgi:hypothetical protein
MRNKHAYDRDAFVPASEVDIVSKQSSRLIVTQAEYAAAREKDMNDLIAHQKLWD